MLTCRFCEKECKSNNSLRNHERLCPSNSDRKYVSHTVGITAWNKGLTKSTNTVVNKMALATSIATIGKIGNKHTEASKENLSKHAKARNLGGHTSKVKLNYTKKDGTVVYLQSSYEIKFATLLDEMNIEWTRPSPLRWVDDAGVDHKYYPDFKVGPVYIDTKNDYLAIKDRRKIELVKYQNTIDLRIVTYKDINKNYIKALQA